MADAIDDFLSGYSEDVATLSRAARALLVELCPDAEEELKRGWKTVSYKHAKAFCAIAPHAKWVNLQFFDGANLPDPNQLLEGTGKSMRHVKLKSADDVTSKALSRLIVAAERATR